jgi:pyruvate/2-oxoacid:ferredoxin oxidoreductase beta subunit
MSQVQEVRLPGTALCPGCGGGTAERIIFNTIGNKNIIFYGGGVCASGGTRLLTIPNYGLHLSGIGVGATGIVRALKARGRTDIKVVSMAGDGAASDIGFAKLSAEAERNENFVQFVMDNEAYMNTGIQRSSQTPWGAWTTTTPTGKKIGQKKNLPMIMALHGIPYIATASIAYPQDLIAKTKKAMSIEGFRYIHVFAPCPTGWRSDPGKTIEIARLAVQSGMFNIYEIENGQVKISIKPKERVPVGDYTKIQGRFSQLKPDDLVKMQNYIDEQWKNLLDLDGKRVF